MAGFDLLLAAGWGVLALAAPDVFPYPEQSAQRGLLLGAALVLCLLHGVAGLALGIGPVRPGWWGALAAAGVDLILGLALASWSADARDADSAGEWGRAVAEVVSGVTSLAGGGVALASAFALALLLSREARAAVEA